MYFPMGPSLIGHLKWLLYRGSERYSHWPGHGQRRSGEKKSNNAFICGNRVARNCEVSTKLGDIPTIPSDVVGVRAITPLLGKHRIFSK